MKYLILALISLTLFSCKQELPTNIKSAVIDVDLQVMLATKNDSIITHLTKPEIDALSRDSIYTLVFRSDYYDEQYKSAKNELDNILKYNPEYSDYDEVKNIKERYYYKDLTTYHRNHGYLMAMEMYHYSNFTGLKKPLY